MNLPEDQGEVFRDRIEVNQIEHRIGKLGSDLFSVDKDKSLGLVFVDAGHCCDAVRHGTQLRLSLLSPNGILVWHDFANCGLLSGARGVPEYLNELQRELPVAHIEGSNMAIHCAARGDHPSKFEAVVRPTRESIGDVWTTGVPRA